MYIKIAKKRDKPIIMEFEHDKEWYEMMDKIFEYKYDKSKDENKGTRE